MLAESVRFVKSLNLEEKFSPRKNADIIWFYIFLPCVIAYFVMLSNFINEKPFIGNVEILHPSFKSLIYEGKQIEIITIGLQQTDGPLWVDDESASSSYLMFSDVKMNRIFKWEDGKGLFTVGKTIYVENSGCKSNSTHCAQSDQIGSSGLLRRNPTSLDLVVCQLGEQAVTVLAENGRRFPLVTHYKGQQLVSPKDAVYSPEGHVYFVDSGRPQGAGGEQARGGVYLLRAEHIQQALDADLPSPFAQLLDATLTAPSGLAFSPDYSRLYVSSAGGAAPRWTSFEVADNGSLHGAKLFYDGSELQQADCEAAKSLDVACEASAAGGAAGGVKMDIHGNLFAAGPGGVLVLSAGGQLIGRLRMPADKPVSNMAFGTDGRLYLTAGDLVARVAVRTKPTRIVGKK